MIEQVSCVIELNTLVPDPYVEFVEKLKTK